MRLNRRRFEISRANAQMPLTKLSKKSRCSGRCFTGDGPIDVTTLAAGRIAAVLGVDLEYLIEDEPAEGQK